MMGFVSSSNMLISPANVSYASSIIERFNNESDYVQVSVKVKDDSETVIEGTLTPEERNKLFLEQYSLFKNKVDGIISQFSQDEFNSAVKTASGFKGNISEEGFKKLMKNEEIEIIWDNTIPLTGGASENEISLTEEVNENETSLTESVNENKEEKNSVYFWLFVAIIIFVILITVYFKLKKK